MRIIYPFPMHLSQGANYHQSITLFLLHLAEIIDVDLITLDSSAELKTYINKSLGYNSKICFNHISMDNKILGVKSNKIFALKVAAFIYKMIKITGKVYVLSRSIQQLKYLLSIRLLLNASFIIESHQLISLNYWREGKTQQALRMRRLEAAIYNNVDYIAAISPTLKNEISLSYKPKNTPFVLPVGVASNFFIKKQKTEYDLIYSGGYSKWKGLDVFYDALRLLDKMLHSKITVLLIGVTSSEKRKIIQLIGDLENVIVKIKGNVPNFEIPQYISKSRIGIATSSYFGDGLLFTSPLKIYEYLAAGLEVIVSSTPTLFESFNSIPGVYITSTTSPRQFADSLHLIIKSDQNRNSAEERIKIASNNTWNERAKKLISELSLSKKNDRY